MTSSAATIGAPTTKRRREGPGSPPSRRFDVTVTQESQTLNEDLQWELARLQSAGLDQVIVADLTVPEFNLPVVKVVIPGLEGVPDGPDYVPGARAQAVSAAISQ